VVRFGVKSTTIKNIDERVWRMARAMAAAQGLTVAKYLESLIREKLEVARSTDKEKGSGSTS